MAKRNYYLYVAELSDDALTDDVVQRNPDRDPAKPLVKVGYIANQVPRSRFAGNDFSGASPVLEKQGEKLLPLFDGANPFSRGRWKEEGILSDLKDVIEDLRERRYTVYNRPLQKKHRLYVIELKREILEERRPNERYSPDGNSHQYSAEPLYVGQTGKSREQRFRDHQRGHNSNLQSFVVRLRNDLTEPMEALNRLEALRGERKLAWRLGQRGYPIYGGH